ncbi:MAG TPA: hypothetical protein VL202_23900 [Pararhizobium sp.]|uniref:hypothetical protein n=1 Tax=Pararhizobium sp. TaxID=1977563 RepID=UPI002CADBC84|nr:hypothetical protein [Pararhizobium sp.]HTO34189.1 hypothetical protein [Pararhizobium sp.]
MICEVGQGVVNAMIAGGIFVMGTGEIGCQIGDRHTKQQAVKTEHETECALTQFSQTDRQFLTDRRGGCKGFTVSQPSPSGDIARRRNRDRPPSTDEAHIAD